MKPADRARACQVAADHLGWLTAEPWTRAATALAGRSTEAARQKRLTADQLAAHQLDITDPRRDPA